MTHSSWSMLLLIYQVGAVNAIMTSEAVSIFVVFAVLVSGQIYIGYDTKSEGSAELMAKVSS